MALVTTSRLAFFFLAYVIASVAVCYSLYNTGLMWKKSVIFMEGRASKLRSGQTVYNWPLPRTPIDSRDWTVTVSLHQWNLDFQPADCRPLNSERLAYITLITNDHYLPGALALFASLHNVGSRYEMACLITADVSESARAQLAFLNVTLIEVSAIEAPFESPTRPAIKHGFTKLHLWNLKSRYDKLFYIDADVLVLHNLDRMFEQYPGDFGVYWRFILENPRFCSAAMVIRPNSTEFQRMMDCYMTTETYDHGDQGFLTTFYRDKITDPQYVQLPAREYMAKPYPVLPYFLSQQIDILHYAHHPKPWEIPHPEPLLEPDQKTKIQDLEFVMRFWWGFYDLVAENLKAAGLMANSTQTRETPQPPKP